MAKGNECVGVNPPLWPAATAVKVVHAIFAGKTCFA